MKRHCVVTRRVVLGGRWLVDMSLSGLAAMIAPGPDTDRVFAELRIA